MQIISNSTFPYAKLSTPVLKAFCTELITVQMGQQNEILCELWLGCESLGDGQSQSQWEHCATSVPQRLIVSNPNF